MKVLVTGVNGQLGYDVSNLLKDKQMIVLSPTRADLDITVFNEVERFIKLTQPDVVIHCAAYTAVDAAEQDRDICYKTNVEGTRNIAEVCKDMCIKLVYISTDYVFSGEGDIPFSINEHPNPINYYGLTKYEGENIVRQLVDKHYIIRISWVFGINGNNFVKTMLKLGKTRDEISVVNDQFGSPTYTVDLAKAIYKLIQSDSYGIYHITNEGYCSWYDFAVEIIEKAGFTTKILPVSSEQYPSVAKRPRNSKLEKNYNKVLNYRMPSWQNAVERFLEEIESEGESTF